MGAEAYALPDGSRATKAGRYGRAGTEGHATNCRRTAKAVPGIKRQGGRRGCPDSKRLCGRHAERAASAADRFSVRAADCLFEPGELAAGALDGPAKRDGRAA